MSKQMASIRDILNNVQDVKVVLVGAETRVQKANTGVFKNKEEHDNHMYLMTRNMIHDQSAFNINCREEYKSLREAHSYLKEECDETVEALDSLLEAEDGLWKKIKADDTEDYILNQIEHIEACAVEVIIEAIHIAAVANKAITQFKLQRC